MHFLSVLFYWLAPFVAVVPSGNVCKESQLA